MSAYEPFEAPCQQQVEQVKKEMETAQHKQECTSGNEALAPANGCGCNNQNEDQASSVQITQSAVGLSVAALVLGMMSVLLCWIPVFVSTVIGLIGAVLAIVHIAKKKAFRGLAIWGLCLSALGFLGGSASSGLYFYNMHKMFAEFEGQDNSNPAFDAYLGQEAPAIKFSDLDGKEIELASLKGKRVMLNFWATWCGPCKMEIPDLVRIAGENPDSLVIIGVSDDPAEMIRDMANKLAINYPLVSVDFDALPEPFNSIGVYPTTIIIDAQGNVEDYFEGARDYDELKGYALGEMISIAKDEDAMLIESPEAASEENLN